MRSKWVEEPIDYDGSQLRRMFAYENFDLLGDSIVAFSGACSVANQHMKDGEDLFAGEKIYSDKMLHFIMECHDTNLETMIAYQRLFSAICMQVLQTKSSQKFYRKGDDIFVGKKKLNISIATANSLSAMIHCAFNINSDNTPVETISLDELKIGYKSYAAEVLELWISEFASMQAAKAKVFEL